MYEKTKQDLDRTVFFLDVLFTVLTFLVVFYIRNIVIAGERVDLFTHIFLIPLFLACITGFLMYFGGYRSPHNTTLSMYAWSILRALALTLGVVLSCLFILRIHNASRLIVFSFIGAEVFSLLAIRAFIIHYYTHSIAKGNIASRVLIIGSHERAKELTNALKTQTEWAVQVIGYLDPEEEAVGTTVNNIPVIGTLDSITTCLKNNVIDEVIIAITRSLLKDAEPIAQACEEEGIPLRFMADVFNVQAARVSLTTAGNIPLLSIEPVAHNDDQLMLKRLFDVAVTIIALPFVLPLFVLVAIAIKLDSQGPVFYVQERVGLRKHTFNMYKFRSMHVNAEEKLKEIEHLNEAEGPIFKIKNDPRVTTVGRFIRKTSIDELPQLFNVLRGEMSLVGPRPMSVRDVDLFDKGIQRKRFSVKPGITCIWQISGRSDLPFTKWLELDLQYIDSWSFALDLKILAKTIPAVVWSKGAS